MQSMLELGGSGGMPPRFWGLESLDYSENSRPPIHFEQVHDKSKIIDYSTSKLFPPEIFRLYGITYIAVYNII